MIKKRGVMLAFVTVLVLSTVALAFPFRSNLAQAFRLATTRLPEPYSELYFAQPDNLPKQVKVGEQVDVGFVVANHETRAYTYRFQATFVRDGRQVSTRSGVIALEDGQSSMQKISIPAQNSPGQLQVVIRLIDKDQTIHFYSEVAP